MCRQSLSAENHVTLILSSKKKPINRGLIYRRCTTAPIFYALLDNPKLISHYKPNALLKEVY